MSSQRNPPNRHPSIPKSKGEPVAQYIPEVRFDPQMGFVWSVPHDEEINELTEELEVLGGDTRVLIKNTLSVPYRWICAINIYFWDADNGHKWSLRKGTGTLIGTRHVLTAAHVLVPENGRNPAIKVVVAPARNGSNEPFGNMEADKWRVSKNWRRINRANRNFDYALITLKDDISFRSHKDMGDRALAFWGSERLGAGTHLKRLKPSTLKGRIVNISGYPGDKCGKEALRRRCSVKDQGSTQWMGHGRLSRVTRRRRLMHHTVDTKKGQSGAAVWLRNKHHRYLVGIHVSPQRVFIKSTEQAPTANIAVRITRELLSEIFSWDRDLDLLHRWENQ